MKAHIQHAGGMAFDAHLDGHVIPLDAGEAVGGRGYGASPKGLLLLSLAGCTGMDVVAILKKMRIPYDSFEVHTDGTLAEEHPKTIDSIHLSYHFTGENLNTDRIARAVQLSEERYCGVAATLRPSVKLTSDILINGQVLER